MSKKMSDLPKSATYKHRMMFYCGEYQGSAQKGYWTRGLIELFSQKKPTIPILLNVYHSLVILFALSV